MLEGVSIGIITALGGKTMDNPVDHDGSYPTISHRVAEGYLSFLADLPHAAALAQEDQNARQELYCFFNIFYENLYNQPDLFGLPLNQDDCIEEYEPHEKEKKQAVTAAMRKPKEMIERGLDFLAQAGIQGRLVGDSLVLEHGRDLIQQTKVSKKFLKGLESAELAVTTEEDRVTLHSRRFPGMLPALQILANACAQFLRRQENQFHFARCDFRALQPGYGPAPLDLYRDFAEANQDRLSALHEFFTGLGYRVICGVSEPFYWIVQYQGDRKIKSTPLLQIEYQERYRNPLRVFIKCASTTRIAALLPHQPQALQDDFMRRVYACRGDECGWCRNNKNLGPTVIEYQGEEKTLCWYSNPEVRGFDDRSVKLIEEYAQMHAELISA
jgi:hypothetical protein